MSLFIGSCFVTAIVGNDTAAVIIVRGSCVCHVFICLCAKLLISKFIIRIIFSSSNYLLTLKLLITNSIHGETFHLSTCIILKI